ncbi:MAG: hypothetical protein WA162_03235, partial [Thermodesulfobacteriota bacterium]
MNVPCSNQSPYFARKNPVRAAAAIAAVLLAVAALLAAGDVFAGEYHTRRENRPGGTADTIACSQCHMMHGSQGSNALVYSMFGVSTGVYEKLLRQTSNLRLCLYCHGTTSPGTVDGRTQGPPMVAGGTTATRVYSAGDFRHNASANNANRHDIDETGTGIAAPTPPGFVQRGDCLTGWADVTLKRGGTGNIFTCIYCHAPHGNNNFRNLRYDPGCIDNDNITNGVTVSYAVTTAAFAAATPAAG